MDLDEQVLRELEAELAWDRSVDASRITVRVRNGIATLSGEVPAHGDKWNAERAAQRVPGVRALRVELRIHPVASGPHPDAEITRAAERALKATACLPPAGLHVAVTNGWITLSGQVDWPYQKEAAVAEVRYLPGVSGVNDQMSVNPWVSSAAIKSDIERALKHHGGMDGARISVEVMGDHVTLKGTVPGSAERRVARHSAWSSAGVRRVSDQLTIA